MAKKIKCWACGDSKHPIVRYLFLDGNAKPICEWCENFKPLTISTGDTDMPELAVKCAKPKRKKQ